MTVCQLISSFQAAAIDSTINNIGTATLGMIASSVERKSSDSVPLIAALAGAVTFSPVPLWTGVRVLVFSSLAGLTVFLAIMDVLIFSVIFNVVVLPAPC